MSTITTHVLDTVLGKPAAGIAVRLEMKGNAGFIPVSSSATDNDGRCRDLASEAREGAYRLTVATGDYMKRLGRSTIYPEISITFNCGSDAHYHLPLLLSDNSYTTYRGS
jgi:5-hydroxyisourate hydrolase